MAYPCVWLTPSKKHEHSDGMRIAASNREASVRTVLASGLIATLQRDTHVGTTAFLCRLFGTASFGVRFSIGLLGDLFLSATDDDLKLRAQLSAARRRNGTLFAAIWCLGILCLGFAGATAFLYLKRDQPLIAFSEEVRGGGSVESLPPLPDTTETAPARRAPTLPQDSVVSLEKREQIIQTLELFARQDGIFSPCFPNNHNHSEIPSIIADWLGNTGFVEQELAYMQARYERLWQRHFRQTASALPGDSSRRAAACQRLSEDYVASERGSLGLDTPEKALAYMRRIVNF